MGLSHTHWVACCAVRLLVQGGIKLLLRVLKVYSSNPSVLGHALRVLLKACAASSATQQALLKEKVRGVGTGGTS